MDFLFGLLILLAVIGLVAALVLTVLPFIVSEIGRDARQAVTAQEPIDLAGSGWADFPIVGESSYQNNLLILVGPTPDGASYRCRAVLRPEPHNAHDRNAIAVYIEPYKVGHLSREDAVAFAQQMAELGLAGRAGCCGAYVNGGWLDAGRVANYGVQLDLMWPLQRVSDAGPAHPVPADDPAAGFLG